MRALSLLIALVACGGNPRSEPPGARLEWELALERGDALAVAFDPGGATLAAASSNDRLRLFDAASGALLAEGRGHRRGISALAFDPRGERLVSGGPDRTALIWRREPLAAERVLEGCERPPLELGWSADGERVLAVTMAGALHVWEAGGGAPAFQRDGPAQRGVMALALSADATRFAWAADGGNLRVWSTADGARLADARIDGLGFVAALALAPGGERAAVGLRDEAFLLVRDLARALDVACAPLDAPPRALAFDAEGARLACATASGAVRIFDARAGTLLTELAPSGAGGAARRLTFDPSGRRLAAAGPGPRLRVWRVEGLRALARGAPLAAVPPPSRLPRLEVEEGMLDLASLAVPGYDPPELRPDRRPWPLERFPAEVRALDGQRIATRGYPIAAELERGEVRRFLLSRYPPGCCFGSVPVLDEWIDVRAPDGVDPLPPEVPVTVEGVLEVGEVQDAQGFAQSLYRLRAGAVR